jgi:predicted glycosyltransferase
LRNAAEKRVWIDLANSPHVLLFGPLVENLRSGGWDVVLTARDHAQTLALARKRWPEIVAIGASSPPGRRAKAMSIARRATELRGFARRTRPAVALSHGSYAQILAARATRVPAVTMMDYEYQPANHLSFRLAKRVIVPAVFPQAALRRFGASPRKVVRYAGFKEELYLAGLRPDERVLAELGIEPEHVISVLRTPPDGALYHRDLKGRFDELLDAAAGRPDVRTVLLPRDAEQARRYERAANVIVPSAPVDGPSLLASADVVIGGGGTMTRESAVLGTPTYTVFAGRLAAVDAELIRLGRLHDLRRPGNEPRFEKRTRRSEPVPADRAAPILEAVTAALADVSA